jgi:hypothetical protein
LLRGFGIGCAGQVNVKTGNRERGKTQPQADGFDSRLASAVEMRIHRPISSLQFSLHQPERDGALMWIKRRKHARFR